MLEMWRRLAGFTGMCLLTLIYFSPESGKKFHFLVCFPHMDKDSFRSGSGGMLLDFVLGGRKSKNSSPI